jgi:methionyl aminopeptidase
MITIKTAEEIEIMAESGKILATVLKELEKMVKPGVTTLELDRAAEALILSMGGKPAFKNYDGFPYTLCASINEVVVHGYPSNYALREGDIIGLDLGVIYNDFYSDSAVTLAVGSVSFEAKRLMVVTKKALRLGIKKAKVGNTIGDIGNTIQRFVEDQGYGVVTELCGHGIGKNLHEDPKIPNFGKRGRGEKILEGMVICIEPMITIGDPTLKKAKDGYGYATKDASLSAHFEHTIAITKNGSRVLTEL